VRFRARKDDWKSYVARVGIIRESACWRLCRARHKRHTYALWTYHALIEQGTSEPWKIIQSLLGHAHLSTTLDTYLRVVNVERARTADGAYEVMRSVIGGN
jgi:integrase